MQTKVGYTFMEMLLCIALLSVLSTITVGVVSISPSESLYIEKISQLIMEAHSAAILQNKDVQIVFDTHSISNGYSSIALQKAYMAKTGIMTYNGNGHIDKGGTVRFCHQSCYDFIFNVGNGAYHIEKN